MKAGIKINIDLQALDLCQSITLGRHTHNTFSASSKKILSLVLIVVQAIIGTKRMDQVEANLGYWNTRWFEGDTGFHLTDPHP